MRRGCEGCRIGAAGAAKFRAQLRLQRLDRTAAGILAQRAAVLKKSTPFTTEIAKPPSYLPPTRRTRAPAQKPQTIRSSRPLLTAETRAQQVARFIYISIRISYKYLHVVRICLRAWNTCRTTRTGQLSTNVSYLRTHCFVQASDSERNSDKNHYAHL